MLLPRGVDEDGPGVEALMTGTMTTTDGSGGAPAPGRRRPSMRSTLIWTAVAVVGAICWGVLAIARGETISALWLLFAALCSYAIAYRFYSRFITYKVLRADDRRATPAERLENGVDFDVTDRRGLFGHHLPPPPRARAPGSERGGVGKRGEF